MFKSGVLNTLEHALTRVLDALNSLLILWVLAPETFARLALAQAAVAPLMLLFVSPETAFYRQYGQWKASSDGALAMRLRSFRWFGWGKGLFALALAFAWAAIGFDFLPQALREVSIQDRFWALSWAFAMVLTPQLSGADREFLRLSLCLKELNALTLMQKVAMIGGTLIAAIFYPGSLMALGVSALAVAACATWVAYRMTRSETSIGDGSAMGPSARLKGLTAVQTIFEALSSYSIWTHLAGVVNGWMQTLDILLAGVFGFPAREVGLYASASKLANLTTALPMALANWYTVWLGRQPKAGTQAEELRQLLGWTLRLCAFVLLQAVVFYFLSPWILSVLSRGRWSMDEQIAMREWMAWMLMGMTAIGITYLLQNWFWLRRNPARFFAWTYLPWLLFTGFGAWVWVRVASAQSEITGVALIPLGSACVWGALLLLFGLLTRKDQKARVEAGRLP